METAWDTIIAGAGSAGCILAERLSEAPGRRVLLLEAGADYPEPHLLPPDIASGLRPTYSHDWGYFCEPGLVGRRFKLPRGKIVGGSSATNAAIALRGARSDYEPWEAAGGPAWSWREVLESFRRIENDLDFADPWHGRGGPISIRRCRRDEWTPSARALVETALAAGHPAAEDHNAPGAMGAGPLPMNLVNGVRQSMALTHLAPARSRANLAIRAGVLVDRLVVERGRVAGVRLAGSGETIRARQVLLAAGAYGSPAILLRSGIGPADELRSLGIDVVRDLPGVGEGLRDHPLVGVIFAADPAGEEPLPVFQCALTLRSRRAEDAEAPDLQILQRATLPARPEVSPTGATVMLFAALMKPLSTGSVRLKSADPGEAPIIDPGYFTRGADLECIVEGLRLLRRLARVGAFGALAREELSPGPRYGDTDDELRAAALSRVETYHHPVGTCRMGPADDPLAVVDGTGAVRGVEALHVIDASIMPGIPSANTNLATCMLAERIAELISGKA